MAKAKKARSFDELTALLKEARERAKEDPRNEKTRELTEQIVKFGMRGVRLPEDTSAELSKDQQVLLALKTERNDLVEAIQAECNELVAERSHVRKVERTLAATAAADELVGLDTEELESRLAAVTSEQRALKGKKRALRIVLDERARQAAAEEQIAKMSVDERREMLLQLQKSLEDE